MTSYNPPAKGRNFGEQIMKTLKQTPSLKTHNMLEPTKKTSGQFFE
jgi:hypothetical protein